MNYSPMKKACLILLVIICLIGCDQNKTYYELFNKNKSITERVGDLNQSMKDIRKSEKGKINRDDVDYLEYEYPIGEGDSYVVSFLFDDKGCYEIGVDGFFATQENATQLMDEFKTELAKSFDAPEEGNELARWLTKDESLTIEIDYAEASKGMAIVTIFANQ